ncbi:hypothetical protein [Arthrobacter sp. ISL-72]|uniref:hypothetical protein n=1 Tax=Arthrobacter sp. ISL-72 TaxID=2819114 RepID=UPI001BE75365|nr:hypothetical protein [Arthrobacter sp. ISL-72]MBT2594752.1 hypothetical protein [Arthrobacter sp. ISL-72]
MTEMAWQDPPTERTRPGQYDEVIAQLKIHPGRWALLKTDWKAKTPPNVLRQNGCETTVRKVKLENGEEARHLYARFPFPKPSSAEVKAAAAEQAKARQAVQTGTALKPPPPAVRRAKPGEVRPSNDMGLQKFMEARRSRGAVDVPE